jgi:hypothetical protein
MFSEIGRARIGFAIVIFSVLGSASADAATASVQYTYDLMGRITTALYDNGVCVVYSYDSNGNRTAQTNTAGSGAPPMTWGTGVWGCAPWTP